MPLTVTFIIENNRIVMFRGEKKEVICPCHRELTMTPASIPKERQYLRLRRPLSEDYEVTALMLPVCKYTELTLIRLKRKRCPGNIFGRHGST